MLLVRRRGWQPLVAAWPWWRQRRLWRIRLLSIGLAPLLLWHRLPLLLLPVRLGAGWPSTGPRRPAHMLGLLLLLERGWDRLAPSSWRACGPQLRLRWCHGRGRRLLGLYCTLRLLLLSPSLLRQA